MESVLDQVIQGDCIELIKELPSDYVHLILFNHKDATEKQQIQLNYSKAYMIKNGQPN